MSFSTELNDVSQMEGKYPVKVSWADGGSVTSGFRRSPKEAYFCRLETYFKIILEYEFLFYFQQPHLNLPASYASAMPAGLFNQDMVRKG